MGGGRTFGIIVFSVLLFISLLLTVTLFVVHDQTKYEKIQEPLTDFIKARVSETWNEDQLNSLKSRVDLKCSSSETAILDNSDVGIDLPFSFSNNILISCPEIKGQTADSVLSIVITQYINEIYNNGVDIPALGSNARSIKQINESLLFIGIIFLILSLTWIGLIILISKPKIKCLTTLGIVFLIASIPTYYFYFLKPITANETAIMELINSFVISLANYQLIVVGFGAILLLNGILFGSLKKKISKAEKKKEAESDKKEDKKEDKKPEKKEEEKKD